jgi:hypothetical protein
MHVHGTVLHHLLARDEFLTLACEAAEADGGDKVDKWWCHRVPFGMYADDAAAEEEIDGGARERYITRASAREGRKRDAPCAAMDGDAPGDAAVLGIAN